jgi:8-oxo-dGTP diphosphatase
MRQFGEKRDGYTYTDRPGAYAIIFNAKNEIAVVETPTGFFLPGGGIEKGESPEQALRREIQEEIGMKMKILRRLGEASQYLYSRIEKRAFNKIGNFFVAELVGPQGEATETEHWLVWLTHEKALKKLNHEFQRWMVEQALEK